MYFLLKTKIATQVKKAEMAEGSRTAISLTPIVFMKNTCAHTIKGGLVFHRSGSPK
jgi:hypothetical protein